MTTYSPAQRAEAIALAARIGPAKASRELGINRSTLRTWIERTSSAVEAATAVLERVAERAPEPVEAEVVERRRPWVERAPAFAADLADGVTEALAATRRAIVDGKSRDARDLGVTFGVLYDKLALLEGHPTRRTESTSTEQRTVVHLHMTPEQVAGKVATLRRELDPVPAEVVLDDEF